MVDRSIDTRKRIEFAESPATGTREELLSSELTSHGHPKFNEFLYSEMKLYSLKNKGYAGGGQPLGNFTRAAKIMENYPNFPVHTAEGMAMMYVMKHFDAIMWALATGRRAPDESLGDISVYMNLIRCMNYDAVAD